MRQLKHAYAIAGKNTNPKHLLPGASSVSISLVAEKQAILTGRCRKFC